MFGGSFDLSDSETAPEANTMASWSSMTLSGRFEHSIHFSMLMVRSRDWVG
jgi:hypothetical protein